MLDECIKLDNDNNKRILKNIARKWTANKKNIGYVHVLMYYQKTKPDKKNASLIKIGNANKER
jgi:hypothetical protein